MVWINLLLLLGVMASGCDQIVYQRFEKSMWTNYIHTNELKKGMSKAEVLGIMGPPGIKESGDYFGGQYTIFFYQTHSMDFDESNTVRNGYTPLVFKGDKLVGIGRRDYRSAVDRAESEGIPKTSLPWGRTQ
jgi:outer membrane protein assembly factor BamE (lipoprotein component of BamABCDE complex)